MDIVLNQTSQTPIYKQIYDQIILQILNGNLTAHYCLPSIRNISRDLEISVITVKNAYELLEQDGYIYTIAGKGCFVSPLSRNQIDLKKQSIMHEKIREIISFCEQFDLNIQDFIENLKNIA